MKRKFQVRFLEGCEAEMPSRLLGTKPANPTTFFKSPGRLEAFSDGVVAIAITLLILEIKVPSTHDASTVAELWRALLERWPSYFAFLLSFFTIYLAWSGHHLMMQQVKTVTLPLVWANAFFLLFVTFLPFPTSLVAEHLTSPSGALAVALYAATNACISLTYLYLYTVSSRGDTEPNRLRYARLNALGGVAICSACVGLAFVSKVLALLLIGAVWVWWSLPHRTQPPQVAAD